MKGRKAMSEVAMQEDRQVARPLKVLVPLIKEDLKRAQSAGMPYYQAAGEKMLEAQASGEMGHSELVGWIKRNFGIGRAQALLYMSYAKTTSDASGPAFSSLEDFKRKHLGHKGSVPGSRRDADWQEPIKESIEKAKQQAARLRDESLSRQQERDAERKLALQLIDIGFRALASKLHPDKGGSRDAMARLNRVRSRLKQSA
jgi:hypothetical protein